MDKTKTYIKAGRDLCVCSGADVLPVQPADEPGFFSQRNLTMLLKQASVLMILTSSLMLLLIETNIDLSGGAGVVYLSGVTCALSLWSDAAGPYFRLQLPLQWVS